MTNFPRLKICYFKAGNVVKEFINTISATDEITGGPDYFIYSAKHYVDKNTQLLFLSLAEKAMVEIKDNCIAKTIKVHKIQKYFGIHIIKLFFYMLRFRPRHIVCVKQRYLHLIYFLAKLIGASFTISVHTDLCATRKIDNLIIRHLLKLSDSIICHGPYLRQQAVQITGSDKKIIEYNASCQDLINLDSPLPAIADLAHKRKIIFIGKMEKYKGVHDLYEASKKLLNNNNQLVLCFAGEGKACKLIRDRSRDDNLEKKVMVFGRLNRSQIANLVRQAWVVVTPTRTEFPEGFCKATMEALSLGVPVIGPDFGPFPYIIENNINGFLYQPNSVSDLQKKLVSILKADVHETLTKGAQKSSKVFLKTNLFYGEAFVQAISKAENV